MYGRATVLKQIPNAEPALAPLGVVIGGVMPPHSRAVNIAEHFLRDVSAVAWSDSRNLTIGRNAA